MNQIEEFRKAIEPYKDGWKSIEIRAACFLTNEKWVNLGARIILSEQSRENIPIINQLPQFPRFKTFQEVYEISELDNFLIELEKGGAISIIGGSDITPKMNNNGGKTTTPTFSFFKSYATSYIKHDSQFILLRVSESNNIFSSIDKEYINKELHICNIPYRGLNDLFQNFIEVLDQYYSIPEPPFIEVVAPIKVRLITSDCKLSGNEITICAEAIGYDDLKDISIGLIEYYQNKPVNRRRVTLPEAKWVKKGSNRTMKKEIKGSVITSAEIFLRFRGEYINDLIVKDPSAVLENPRIKIYNHFDANLTILMQYLESSDANIFEKGIALLLYFCGFNTGSYGLMKGKRGISSIQDEIDIIAFTPDNSTTGSYIIAGECTTQDINANEKISKLSRRVKEIQKLLPEFTIIPLIFTTLENDHILELDVKKAEQEGIGVAAKENIVELLEMAKQMTWLQKQQDKILTYIRKLSEG
jgi:hypothetical protein